MKATRAVLIVEVNGNLHQANLTQDEAMSLVQFARVWHGGTLRVNENPITTIALESSVEHA